MIVRKCDRCGAFFECEEDNAGVVRCDGFQDGCIILSKSYGLCPACMKDFKNWAHGWEEKQTGWISVKDRLPDQELLEYWKRYSQRSVEVLVMIEGASHSTTLTWDGNRFSDDCHNEYEVTHWMPLPEPPGDSDAQD